MDCLVTVFEGSLRGKECTAHNGRKYYSFEGIPYAKPPVGKLRFRDPQPAESWAGIRDATKPGQKCAQMDPYGKNALDGSEDCLFLNVYTPSLPAEKIQKLPVLFFVHGGRLLVGQGDYYRPDYFMQQDVILVTINYRLHVLGFLCLNTKEVPGNAGCKDTIMALKWVKNNIRHFNGDENNVTAFAESAGAGIVTSYVTSKMADGLVHKIIAQSGVSLSDLYLIDEDPLEKAKHLASSLGKDLDDAQSLYEFLSAVPIEDLVFAAAISELSRPPHIINAFFLPTIEKKHDSVDRFFEEHPVVVFKENRYKKLPILMGSSSHEGALFIRLDDKGNIQYLKDIQHSLPRYLHLKYDSPKSIKIAQELKQFYFKNKEIGDKSKIEYINFASDTYFNRDTVRLAEYYSKYCNSLYFYYFTYDGNMNTRTLKKLGMTGASHGDIIQYEFYKKSKAEICDKKDKEMVNFVTETWSNFAKNGKPSWSNQQVEWPTYQPGERLCLNIGRELTVQMLPIWDRIHFWIQHTEERSKI